MSNVVVMALDRMPGSWRRALQKDLLKGGRNEEAVDDLSSAVEDP